MKRKPSKHQPSLEGVIRKGDEPVDAWLNIYRGDMLFPFVAHPSKAEAINRANKRVIACVHVRYYPGRAAGKRIEEVL